MTSSLPGVNSDDTNDINHASITPPSADDSNLTFAEVCERIHGKVEAFLSAEPKNERVKNVQAQTRRGLNVIAEALERYRYVHIYST